MKPKWRRWARRLKSKPSVREAATAICAKCAGIDLERARKGMDLADGYWLPAFEKVAALLPRTKGFDMIEAAKMLDPADTPSARELERRLMCELGLSFRQAEEFVQAHAVYLVRISEMAEDTIQSAGAAMASVLGARGGQ